VRWREEIEELHDFFEAYFTGAEDSLARAEAVLAPEFTIVGPDGSEADRAATIRMLQGGHAHTSDLTITTSDHRLLHDAEAVLVASYVEHHDLGDRQNHRLSTVVFRPDPAAPNGLNWLRVHETWTPDSAG